MAGEYWPLRIEAPNHLVVLDQTLLPHEERYLELHDVASLCEAIRSLRVRGAPLLGLCGAAGMALATTERGSSNMALETTAREIEGTRPTAIDLGAAVRKALQLALDPPEGSARRTYSGAMRRTCSTARLRSTGRSGATARRCSNRGRRY
ncbi:MAG: hypothetical protein U5Q44_13990 [Dehalococcoidia bacterium]|nr:hypothetical protein [Dehalococcoidia bacterium]